MFSRLLRFVVIATILIVIACGSGQKKDISEKAVEIANKRENVEKDGAVAQEPINRRGRLIYKKHCNLCHGSDGRLGLSGASDLATSTLSLEERIYQVTNGQGAMTPYKNILSESQIEDVSKYIEVFRK